MLKRLPLFRTQVLLAAIQDVIVLNRFERLLEDFKLMYSIFVQVT